jgi:protein phosphatase
MAIEWGGCSVKGLTRLHNEDYYAASLQAPGTAILSGSGMLLVVADGLGGEQAGERASQVATQSMMRSFYAKEDRLRHRAVESQLRRAMAQAHLDILADARSHDERRGMGTTLTAAFVHWPHVTVAHAGDSRCYRFRKGALAPLTRDHTLEGVLRETGVLLPDPKEASEYKNVLWNYLGGKDNLPDPFISTSRLHQGDLLLLTTDGLTNVLPDGDLASVLNRGGDAQSVCRKLVGMACERRSGDDVTALLARLGPAPRVLGTLR